MKIRAAQTSVLDEIVAFNSDRKPKMVRLKYRRMAKDPFAFFRGTDHLFATHWPHLQPPDLGPMVLICGDLHLENFGGYRTDDGDFLYDINDFDEALVAPCTLDLVRCTTSILLAAQLWNFTPVQAMRTLLAFLDRYRGTVVKSARNGQVGAMAVGTARGPIWSLLERPIYANHLRFLDRYTKRDADGTRRIEHRSGRFRAAGDKRKKQIGEAVEQYGKDSDKAAAFQVLDVAFRIAGTGSLGLERYAVLIRGEGQPEQNRILDVKESRPSALASCTRATQQLLSGSEAQRVVQAQRQLQAKPPTCLDVLNVDGKMYRMRELIPEENRTGLDQLRKDPTRLRRAVAIAGRLAGWAHIRGGRLHGEDRSAELARWATGPGLDAVISSAVRYAERSRRDYKSFRRSADKLVHSLKRGRVQEQNVSST